MKKGAKTKRTSDVPGSAGGGNSVPSEPKSNAGGSQQASEGEGRRSSLGSGAGSGSEAGGNDKRKSSTVDKPSEEAPKGPQRNVRKTSTVDKSSGEPPKGPQRNTRKTSTLDKPSGEPPKGPQRNVRKTSTVDKSSEEPTGPPLDDGKFSTVEEPSDEPGQSSTVVKPSDEPPRGRQGVNSDEDSDPVLVAKREKAAMKHVLAAGAEAAIKRAAHNLERDQNRARLQGTSVFILASIISLVGACHVYLLNWELGPPPTLEAQSASEILIPVFLFTAVLALSAFVILYLKLTHLIIGLSWMILLILMEYMITVVLSKAAHTLHKADFEDVKIYSKHHFQLHQTIPKYVAHYEILEECCGWGHPDRKFDDWPTLLETNDLPDSCCIEQFYGCGKSAVATGVPSGYVMALSPHEFGAFMQAYSGEVDTQLWFDAENSFSKVLRQFPPWKGVPDDLLRFVDEVRDTPMYYYMGDNTDNINEPVSYIYKSYGQAENYRLKKTIKEKTCNTDVILKALKAHTIYILLYSSVLLLICFVEAVVFWYYYIEERADTLTGDSQPGEFTLLQMERICVDDRFNAIIIERKKQEAYLKLKKQHEEEEEARDRLLAEIEEQGEDSGNENAGQPQQAKPKRKRNVIRGGAKRK